MLSGSAYYSEKYSFAFAENKHLRIAVCDALFCAVIIIFACFFIYDYRTEKKRAIWSYILNVIAIVCMTPIVGLATICVFGLQW